MLFKYLAGSLVANINKVVLGPAVKGKVGGVKLPSYKATPEVILMLLILPDKHAAYVPRAFTASTPPIEVYDIVEKSKLLEFAGLEGTPSTNTLTSEFLRHKATCCQTSAESDTYKRPTPAE